MIKVKKRKRISKDEIKRAMYEPKKDFFMEKLDAWTYKLHFTPSDAVNSIQHLSKKFEVESAGKGHYGSAYIVRHEL